MLDSVGKVFEQVICKQIAQHYDTVLSPYSTDSTAYRKAHSCETTMIRLVEDSVEVVSRPEFECRDLINGHVKSIRLFAACTYAEEASSV